MSSTLLELSKIISDAVLTLSKACDDNSTPFPDMRDAPSSSSDAFRSNPEAAEAADIIAAATTQLASMVLSPPFAILDIMAGHLKSAALRVCLEANVTEILREAGPEGMHVNEIGGIAQVHNAKIARVLRYLATHHVYKEISPDVFTNTRISLMLDTGKAVKDIHANPDQKHDNTPGFAAFAGHFLDDMAKASSYLWETMSDPAVAHSTEVNHTPFSRAFKWDDSLWRFYEQPEQRNRQRRFGVAMQGVARMMPPGAITEAYDWASLPSGSTVVDVGGGVGAASMILAQNFPNINILVQDVPTVVEDAKEVWEMECPEPIHSGRVSLQVQDFFEPQKIQNASVFLLKNIIHDWPDAQACRILSRLREAAQQDTKLILIETMLPYACHDLSYDVGQEIPGAAPKEASPPLLSNYGVAGRYVYDLDLVMLVETNSHERTVADWVDLLERCGWRLTKIVRKFSCGFLQPAEAVPIF